MAKIDVRSYIIDTIIVLIGFGICIYAAVNFFLTYDTINLLIFLVGLIIVSYGFGRRFRNYWE